MNERANQLAHHLRSLGARPEMRVGISVERSFEMLVGVLAILKSGAAYLPLDPEYPAERLAFMLEDAQVTLLLTERHLPNAYRRSRQTGRHRSSIWIRTGPPPPASLPRIRRSR